MDIKQAIAKLVTQQDLQMDEMHEVMHSIMTGNTTPAQLGAFLVALRMKGETVDELTAAAQVMREHAISVHVEGEHDVDIVGTGGDQRNTFNISTTSAFVVAAAGGQVAKHGNRSVSSCSGSADLLETAGVNLALSHSQVQECLERTGICFLFAPNHHTAMQYTAETRKQLGIRTLFNLLGPLTNPARVKHQVIGVFADNLLEPFANVIQKLGVKHGLVIHSYDGLDEISINAETHIVELKQGEITDYTIHPEQFGFAAAPLDKITVTNPKESYAMMQAVFKNQAGPARDVVALNAGAAIYAADLTESLAAGIELALAALSKGSAWQKFNEFKTFTQSCKSSSS